MSIHRSNAHTSRTSPSASSRFVPPARRARTTGAADRSVHAAHGLSEEQLRELERALRSSRAELERSMVSARIRAIDARARRAASGRKTEAELPPLAHDECSLARHRDLVEAIRRLEGGTYGLCAHCRRPIGHERLADHPEATHCAECMALFPDA